jgi:hypothetical protein
MSLYELPVHCQACLANTWKLNTDWEDGLRRDSFSCVYCGAVRYPEDLIHD